MRRGRWTYHKTYKAGCCGPSLCVFGLLTLPIMPFIGGYDAIKNAVSDMKQTATVAEAEVFQDGAEGYPGVMEGND